MIVQKLMPIDFVLISSDVGKEMQLARDLRSIENVKDVYVVYGVYDVVAKVESETAEKVKDTISLKIRPLGEIRSMFTMSIVE